MGNRRHSRSAANVLAATRQVRLKPAVSDVADTEARLQALQKDGVVDRVEGRRQVQKDQGGRVTTVDSLEDIR